jgi:thioredoxin reductase (NADPH)
MKLPIIFVIDDDLQVLKAIQRDMKNEYRNDYRILSTSSAKEALDLLKELQLKNETVAMFLTDQRMPEMEGVDFLEASLPLFPEAKRVLLTAYSDTSAAIKAINEVRLDYYLTKPWDPPEEKLYPIINDLLDDWQANFRPRFEGVKVLGYQWSPKSHNIKDFLSGNLIPYRWIDMETNPETEGMMKLHSLSPRDLPVVFFEDGSLLKLPDLPSIAVKLGMKAEAAEKMYDVVIIGAGPAGLASAVYGASEGLKTLLVEKRAPGGQAGTSSRIENYLGFPAGLSGSDLTRRALAQATRFGTEFLSPVEVVEIKLRDNYKILKLSDGKEINARSIIITTGVDYRQLEAKGIDSFSGAGVYYGAATTEAFACKDQDIYVIGGGNSAGQAAMYLSAYACNVFIVIRKGSIESGMSQYLVDQISDTENISVISNTEVIEVMGNEKLEKLLLRNVETQETKTVDAGSLFVFIGAKPVTEWLGLHILKDKSEFIETGRELLKYPGFKKSWKLSREPFMLETCVPGIFAAGDVRSGAMNRVASAVGEGAMAIKFVHQYLSEI